MPIYSYQVFCVPVTGHKTHKHNTCHGECAKITQPQAIAPLPHRLGFDRVATGLCLIRSFTAKYERYVLIIKLWLFMNIT